MDLPLDRHNKLVYLEENIISFYSKLSGLQKPETTILNLIKPMLADMKMLDIGIGCGRTTAYFAKLVKNYVGIDYSKNMIDASISRFIKNERNSSLFECDVRSMNIFKDNCFDFILFSFNGLDYMDYDDRIASLKEIRRVGMSGGFFAFSTHNILSLNNLVKFHFRLKLIKEIIKYYKLNELRKNCTEIIQMNYAIINDGAHNFKLHTFYINPVYQIEQLKSLGFKNIRIFSLDTGQEIKDNLEQSMDAWLYFLCEIND